MKAIEYYEKYRTTIDTKKGIKELMIEMNNEAKELIKKRNAVTDNAGRSIIKELNQKWNALARIFEKAMGEPILVEDGFLASWKRKIPEL